MKSPLNYLIAVLMPLTAIAQSPEFSVYGGLPMFIRDNASPFGKWGAQEGGLDGLNLSAGAELQLPLWNDWSMHAGLDLYSIRAVGSTSTAQLTGASPRIGLGYTRPLGNLLVQARGSLGLASMRTSQTLGAITTKLNEGLYTWGSLSAPASLGLRVSMPYTSGRLYAELSYRYFMFDDGLDGMGGGGTRIGGHDDQMLIGVAGYTWNLQNLQSRDQRELVQAKKAAQLVPSLKKASEELKIAQAELMDELEVLKIQKSKAEQRLDSALQGLLQTAGGSANFASGAIGAIKAQNATRFVVVIGSFRSDRLAAQYVSRLKSAGVNCSITEGSNGFVRVYTGPFQSET
ncbi:MAG: SPOR domain-containing protein, partial [Flavobacteriaceae bacterium]|nr:SPOR domain-containing protein [Flavobacteriaceae bacterium]